MHRAASNTSVTRLCTYAKIVCLQRFRARSWAQAISERYLIILRPEQACDQTLPAHEDAKLKGKTWWIFNQLDVLLGISLDLAKGLRDLHECGLVHRDFKLANVFCAEKSHPFRCDFGLLTEAGALKVGHSDPRHNCFAKPESQVVEKSMDVYAFGVSVLEAIFGEPVMVWYLNDHPAVKQFLARTNQGMSHPLEPPRFGFLAKWGSSREV